MDVESQRVAEGMAEIFAEARVRDDLPRRAVDLSAADTRPCRFYALELGAQWPTATVRVMSEQ